MGSVSASNEKVVCGKVCFKRLTKFQVKKKRFDRPSRLFQGQLVLCNVHMYDECAHCVVVHVKLRLCRLNSQRY